MLLNDDIQLFFFVQMILNFQREINVIMYIIEFFLKKFESFHLKKNSIRYEISNFMFLKCLK
jgi:hypothetical protein